MKKIMVAGLLIAAAALGCKTHYPVATSSFSMPAGKADMENGKNLAFNVCGQCHYNHKKNSFVGEEMRELPGFMGTIYSANLTHGHIADQYTDKELFYLIKTGVAKDGRFIPYMIRPTIADEDLRDIIAYLRSNDEPLKQNDASPGETHVSFLGKIAGKIVGSPLDYHYDTPPPPDAPVKEGRYLVDIVGCYHCHSKSMISLNYNNPEDSKGYMAGGMKFKVDGEKVYASNLTPDKETGIGRYGTESFRRALHEGIALDGRALHYPMPRFKHLTDEQCDAILAYIQTLEPKTNHVKGQ